MPNSMSTMIKLVGGCFDGRFYEVGSGDAVPDEVAIKDGLRKVVSYVYTVDKGTLTAIYKGTVPTP